MIKRPKLNLVNKYVVPATDLKADLKIRDISILCVGALILYTQAFSLINVVFSSSSLNYIIYVSIFFYLAISETMSLCHFKRFLLLKLFICHKIIMKIIVQHFVCKTLIWKKSYWTEVSITNLSYPQFRRKSDCNSEKQRIIQTQQENSDISCDWTELLSLWDLYYIKT